MNTMFENRQLRSSLWLVHTLKRHKRLTLAEINHLWKEDTDISKGRDLPPRTFHFYRNTVQDVLDIVIDCHKPTNTYYISTEGDNQLTPWIISSFNVSRVAMDRQEVKSRILLEAPPNGMEHFDTIVESFRRNCCLQIVYQKFDDSEPYGCHLQPYCLKLYQQRWYLLAVKDHGEHLLTFALDRMQQVDLLDGDSFTLPADFDAKGHFEYSFGIWASDEAAPLITLRAYGNERKYLRSLPLHHSQAEVHTTADYSDFTIECHPTRDLLLHLLSHGRGLEVTGPEKFRLAVAQEARAMAERYGDTVASET